MSALHQLVPAPWSFTALSGSLTLDAGTTLGADPSLADTRRWLARTLGAVTAWDLFPAPAGEARIRLLLDPSLDAEAYRLEVRDAVVISAGGAAGAFYGAQTLLQLMGPAALRQAPVASVGTWPVPRVAVEDKPRFGYRGTMLDVARHFMPKDNVLRFIEVMAMHKLNVLHLHLTDDQGWRIQIHRYPKLTETGAWRRESSLGSWRAGVFDGRPHGGFYTQDDLREIVAFAADRHITVIPEIDVPGHSQAAIAAYPELGSGDGPVEVWTRWGINETVLEVSETSLEFYRNVLDEVMEIFPSPWISLGGDEVPLAQWQSSAQARAKVAELGLDDVSGLHSWFVGQLALHLASHGRATSVWDEIGDGGLPDGALVASWRGYEGGVDALRKGYDVVMCPEHKLYLDHRQAEGDEEPVPVGFVTTLQSVYEFDPLPGISADSLRGRLLGAQANIWTEHLDSPRRVHFAAFPRLSAISEVFWSRPDARDYDEFLTRLTGAHLARLEAMGVEYRPLAGPTPWQQRPGVEGWKRDYDAEQLVRN
ncbi:beta-N-acetylhexosaminidase [Paenarthrobacter nitroguajacolicus]|uniref:beta-N-acetylhexosaminidase n=1 Tax=Paenarthrobacter nitroguajacolicus TaxID=211146 RepID=UPI00248BD47B|nr:beta-N-acetylhexosaminidase [Paenarthrobacter nitroguajacolicus]MDI2033765.1 Beta-hexosaminidase [Paenarthrobacter nitroguajacolicus]